MSSELSRTELSCLITHKKGFAFKSKDYIPSGVPVVRVSNFTWDSISTDDLRYVSHEVASSTKVVQLNEYDVIVATVGSWPQNPDSIVGKVVRVPCPLSGALLNQNTVRLRVNDDNLVNQKYLYIALKTKEFSDHLISKAQGSANQASITLSDIFSYAIPWGTYTQRKYIVNVIDSINDKIVIANQINQTLEQMAQALFKSWFVDFEPVKAKMAVLEAGGSQADATLAAMTAISGKDADALAVFERGHPEQYAELKATAELFPSAMQDSELGDIPEGWYLQRFSNIATLHYGKALKKTERIEGPYSVYGSGGITGSHNSYLVEGPGIIVGRKGSIGTLYWEDGKFHPIDTVYYVENKEGVPLTYLYYLMGTLNLSSMNTDAAVPGLNRDNVYRLETINPEIAILNEFNNHVSALRNMIQRNKSSTETLTQLRDTLLPKLLSGEITLPDAEQAVSEVANV
ncbi:restriction endonuclease subunit S [Citrobacter portucalensis]|uniref:restriction endonuclease subunit S n=1 Tax=Citrobacter portucalensis TaxID=1639133 RepID=UPI002882AD58|nr:restriction endonuclease subunit S [Enterobacter sp. BRE11]